MKFNIIAILTAFLVFSQVDAVNVKCYSGGGKWGTEKQKHEASGKADAWCTKLGVHSFKAWEQKKSCVSYSGGKIMFRLGVGRTGGLAISPNRCWAMMTNIILGCERGGADDSSNGWRPRYVFI